MATLYNYTITQCNFFNHNSLFCTQLQDLLAHCSYVRKTRGDGNCFFRAFGFAYLEKLLQDKAELHRYGSLSLLGCVWFITFLFLFFFIFLPLSHWKNKIHCRELKCINSSSIVNWRNYLTKYSSIGNSNFRNVFIPNEYCSWIWYDYYSQQTKYEMFRQYYTY